MAIGRDLQIFLLSALGCGIAILPLKGLLVHFGIIDLPNVRSSHSVPTVRGGGIAIVLVVLISGISMGRLFPGFEFGFELPLLVLSLVSLADDLYTVSPKIRIIVQTAVSAVALRWLMFGLAATPVETGETVLLSFGLLLIGMVGFINAFNFMDGINGIATFQAILTGLGMLGIGRAVGLPIGHPPLTMALCVSGAAAGFLPFNFPRARMFMGDVGSASIGFVLAFTTFWIAREGGWWLIVPLSCLQANFILDTGITLIRRFFRGEQIQKAHREHFYQRLAIAGWSHTRITLTESICQIAAIAALIFSVSHGKSAIIISCSAVIALWLVLFAFAERIFNKSGQVNLE
jgi:UDP-GlcNAc:undecaprenyl-phosphate GlcNAc-1-phosphate transferase